MQTSSVPLHICSHQRYMMGAHVSIHLAVPLEQVAQATNVIDESFLWLEEVETRLTRFNANSELMRLNHHAEKSFNASPILFDCLAHALAAAEQTDGLYDPTLLPQLEVAGYDRDFDEIAHRDCGIVERILPETGRWREIQIEQTGMRITRPRAVQVDLGGIAKGWAADYLADHLLVAYTNVLVNIGGDLRVHGGPTPESLWAIALDNPRHRDINNEEHLAVITPGQGGIATSGANRRWWLQGKRISHHIIDPRTGRPALLWTPQSEQGERHAQTLIAAATAFAETAAQAEVSAKIALLRGFPGALDEVEASWATTPEKGTALVMVLGDGTVHASLNLEAWFRHQGVEKGIWYIER